MGTKLASSLVSRDQALSTSLVSGKQENRDTVDMVRGGTEVVLVRAVVQSDLVEKIGVTF